MSNKKKLNWNKPDVDKLSKPPRHMGGKRNKKRHKVPKIKYNLEQVKKLPQTDFYEYLAHQRDMTSTDKGLGLKRCVARQSHNPVAAVRKTKTEYRRDPELGWVTKKILDVYEGRVVCWDCLEHLGTFRDKSLEP